MMIIKVTCQDGTVHLMTVDEYLSWVPDEVEREPWWRRCISKVLRRPRERYPHTVEVQP